MVNNKSLKGRVMLSLIQIFIQAFLVGFSGAVAPGPLLTYNIQLTYKKGFWVGPKLILGHAILEGILIIGIICGLGSFIQLPATKITLWLLGGLLLCWMGYDLIWKETRRNLQTTLEVSATGETVAASKTANLPPVFAGMIISLSNPYWALWWAMIGLGLITQALSFGWPGVLIFFGGHILSDLLWYSFISAAVAKGRRYLSATAYRWLLRVCGIFLIIIAIGFILDALKTMGTTDWLYRTVIDLFAHLRRLV
jgi:threonine/homoserine/homoserine lactone efflux protein